MSDVDFSTFTVRDMCLQAMRDCMAVGKGQTPAADDVNEVWSQLQLMLAEWQTRPFSAYVTATGSVAATGAQSYTIGPGGNIDTGINTVRPDDLSSAFIRLTPGGSLPVDFDLIRIASREQYNLIKLKSLVSWPDHFYYEPTFPLGTIFPYPIPQSGQFTLFVSYSVRFVSAFANLSTIITLPTVYYNAIRKNLAVEICPQLGREPSTTLIQQAKRSLQTLKLVGFTMPENRLPIGIIKTGTYNIYSDNF